MKWFGMCAVLLLCVLLAGCAWVADLSPIQGEYVCSDSPGESISPWIGSRIVLRGGSGTLFTASGERELTYTVSDQASPWITLNLEDGTSLQLQYRRPGQLSYYDAFGGSVAFRRVER